MCYRCYRKILKQPRKGLIKDVHPTGGGSLSARETYRYPPPEPASNPSYGKHNPTVTADKWELLLPLLSTLIRWKLFCTPSPFPLPSREGSEHTSPSEVGPVHLWRDLTRILSKSLDSRFRGNDNYGVFAAASQGRGGGDSRNCAAKRVMVSSMPK